MKLTKLAKVMDAMRPEELAVKTGLSFNTIRKAMKGEDVSAGSAELIAHALNKNREDLA